MNKLNTHSYDGTLSFNEDIIEFDENVYNDFFKKLTNPHAKKMAESIKNKQGNNDTSNNIDALNIFTWVISQKMSDDVFKLLEEQLSDTTTRGPCPQGRTTRLFQIYLILKDT